MKSIEEYIKALEKSLVRHFAPGAIYHGKEGAMRLAREVGYGLASYSDKEISDIRSSLYSRILIRFTFTSSTGVPVDLKPWLNEMNLAISKGQRVNSDDRP